MRFRVMLLGLVLLTMFSASGVFAHEEDGESEFADDVTFLIDGEAYQLEGTTDEQQALPGHEWLQVSETEYFALHHNIGPDAAESWWATEAVNDELLYVVKRGKSTPGRRKKQKTTRIAVTCTIIHWSAWKMGHAILNRSHGCNTSH